MIDLGFLAVLADPAFVGAWYALGLSSAMIVGCDVARRNRALPPTLKVAWPLFAVFSSGFGLPLYLATCRPGGQRRVADAGGLWRAHHRGPVRLLTATSVYGVAGQAVGILVAMIAARALAAPAWTEIWAAAAAGLWTGWVAQIWAMRRAGSGWGAALAKAGRAEVLSIVPVALAVGAITGWVMPQVVGGRPPPTTVAFWGFAALALVTAWLAALPVNAWLFGKEWKHAMG